MNILITGSKGFVGSNFISYIKSIRNDSIFEFDQTDDKSLLMDYCKNADVIYHFAGVNRTEDKSKFFTGNLGFLEEILRILKEVESKAIIVFTSSIQADQNNDYGLSKKAAEESLLDFAKNNHSKAIIYRLPNLFGKWSRPNYNSVIATFCYNISRQLPVELNKNDVKLELLYIDDLLDEFVKILSNINDYKTGYHIVKKTFEKSLYYIHSTILSFRGNRFNGIIPNLSDEFTSKLYSTYLSYLPDNSFDNEINPHIDDRGYFVEVLKSTCFGQISINLIKPNITKGNHWHMTKNEKFLVIKGHGVIRFRKVDDDVILSYEVDSSQMKIVDIPPGYTHNITNNSKDDMIVLMWANEIYNQNSPDTYYLKL